MSTLESYNKMEVKKQFVLTKEIFIYRFPLHVLLGHKNASSVSSERLYIMILNSI